ncbi:MAG: outer membrane protein transport protein [Desulfuromonadales bacterium]|nr:outer membrane protein transport protein [Desulfuromonadales bacterium]
MKLKTLTLVLCSTLIATQTFASGYGVFTQGASGLGQANAVVAHPSGPSSLYFNPALLNDLPGREIEVGTTLITADREINLDSGGHENAKSEINFPSTLYYTQQINDRFSAGLGVFFPFGLSNEWDDDYEGRYIGTSGEVTTINFNPVVSFKVNDKLSLAAGLDLLYLDATLKGKINQSAAYLIAQNQGAPLPPLAAPLGDISQKFTGDDWGLGYNLGALFKATDRVSIGATYRSHIDVDADGDVSFNNVSPYLASLFPEGNGGASLRLPAQATAGLALQVTEPLIIEVGARWEDWDSYKELKVNFDTPVFGQTSNISPRDWHSTWTYNIGGQYRINDTVALNAGYLYGENAVPSDTFEPIIPDTDAHLFTIGTDLTFGSWTVSGAFGLEHHEDRDKDNTVGDPLGSLIAGQPVGTANGKYQTDIYLVALSVAYAF